MKCKRTCRMLVFLLFLFSGTHIMAEQIISVVYFDNTKRDPEYQWLSKGIADMLITDLSSLPGITIIERAALEQILQEQALALSGLTDDSTIEIGKLLQADHIISGSYIFSHDQLRIDIKMVQVATADIRFTAFVQGTVSDIFLLQTRLTKKISQFLQLSPVVGSQKQATTNMDALATYYTAIDHLDHKRYEQAKSGFQSAVQLDPLFYKAQQGLADSYKFLKAFKEYRQQREVAELYSRIDKLEQRLSATQWMTYADVVQSPPYRNMTPQQQQAWNQAHNEYLICNTPAQCTWHIMLTMDEIARKRVDYFNDAASAQKLWQKMDALADSSRTTFADDPFLSEILYVQLLAYYSLEDYPRLKSRAEEFMLTYPDYRLVEAVEDWYALALEKLNAQKP